jgi:hypothetical protein
MSGQRRANWRTEAAQMVGQLDARLLVRIEAAEGLATRRFDTVGIALDSHAARIEKLERQNVIWLIGFTVLALPHMVRVGSWFWAVSR